MSLIFHSILGRCSTKLRKGQKRNLIISKCCLSRNRNCRFENYTLRKNIWDRSAGKRGHFDLPGTGTFGIFYFAIFQELAKKLLGHQPTSILRIPLQSKMINSKFIYMFVSYSLDRTKYK